MGGILKRGDYFRINQEKRKNLWKANGSGKEKGIDTFTSHPWVQGTLKLQRGRPEAKDEREVRSAKTRGN